MSKKRIFSEEETNKMIEMYLEGQTYSVIAKEIKTKASKVSSYLKSLGYGLRPKNTLINHDYLSTSRKYYLDEDFFSEINTDSKAYWLGFLFADGYISKQYDKSGKEKGGNIELCLQAQDKYHIANFLHDIKSTAPITDKIVKLNGNEYKACRTKVSSIKMVNDLVSHGCIPKKSLILTEPIDIPDELVQHFIRGYFDGDGCVAFYPEQYGYTYSILGTVDILNYIVSKSEVQSYQIISFKHKKCYELRIYGKKNIKIFHNYIYADKAVYLERKYQKSLSMLKYCELDDCRNDTQKLADLLNANLYIDDTLINDLSSFYIKSETAAMADLLD